MHFPDRPVLLILVLLACGGLISCASPAARPQTGAASGVAVPGPDDRTPSAKPAAVSSTQNSASAPAPSAPTAPMPLPLGSAAGAVPAATASGPAPVEADSENHALSSALIRQHRLQHLQTRLTVAPEVLKSDCRYESEISTAPARGKVVLTFDDGPEPGQTEFILETLHRHKIPAIFFLVGHKAQQHPELVQRIRAEGMHLVGNHSWDHPNFHDIDVAAQTREVQETRALLPPPGDIALFRYPYGNSTCATNDLVHELGYRIVGWHIDSCDWAFDHNGSVDVKEATICGVLPQHREDFVGHVLSAVRAHNGGIILMHEIHPHTVHQLEAVINGLLESGYSFSSLSDGEFSASLR